MFRKINETKPLSYKEKFFTTERNHFQRIYDLLQPRVLSLNLTTELAATLRWFTAGGAIRIALRRLSQTWKLRHYDVIDDVITRKL